MADLIERQAAIDEIARWIGYIDEDMILRIQTGLKKVPSAQPERRGEWVKDGETYALYKCSACNEICSGAGWANCIKKEQMYNTFKFCPHCGARMEKDNNG